MKNLELIYKEMKSLIDDLQYHWKEKTEKEVEYLCKEMDKISRGENAWFRKDALSDPDLPKELLRIGDVFNNNHIVLEGIISYIHNMFTRYGLIISDDIYGFLLKNIKNKKVAYSLITFITDVPQFNHYEYKWEYILSIPNIAPKKKSILFFHRIINKRFTEIPEALKSNVIKIFQDYLDKNPDLHEYTKEEYEEIIKKLQQ